jgi:hypothetical protein
MAPNYQSIVALMNIILIACAGFTIIGFYRILKVFGLVPWEASTPREMTFPWEQEGLDTDLMLPNLRVADTAFIPGGKTQDQAASQRAEVY